MTLFGWLREYPRLLEISYQAVEQVLRWADPLIKRTGYPRVNLVFRWPEEISKQRVFDCKMCGQCTLHETGMTCPMTCPKSLRNGPCGGVHGNGACEVLPEMKCIWVEAYERAQKMDAKRQSLLIIQPPLNHQLQGSSAWINLLCCEDDQMPPAWKKAAGVEEG
jgi:hypothetical protein